MIIGAYAAGVAFASHDEREHVDQDLKPLIELLTPLFFIMLGASMEFDALNPFSATGRKIWGFTGLLLAVAVAGKLLSAI